MSTVIELYRIDVENDTFIPLDVIETYGDLAYAEKLNGVGLARFEVDLYDTKANTSNLVPGVTIALIKRDNAPKWLGVIGSIRGNSDGASGQNLVEMYSYLYLLTSRYTAEGYFKSDDAGDIAWDLVNNAQNKTNGALRIQQGTIETIGDSQETLDYGEVAQALINASDNINGYDFTFVPKLDANNQLDFVQFNVFKSVGNFRDDLPPLAKTNTDQLNFYIGDTIRNSVTALGFGTGDSVISSSATNTSSQVAYSLKEDIIKYPNVKSKGYLDNIINEHIKQASTQVVELQVRLVPNEELNAQTIGLGDVLKFNYVIDNTLINFIGSARVIAKSVQIDRAGEEYLYLNFEYVR